MGDEKMAVVRVNKTQNYTVMSNYHFKEKDMSLKAKGLLSLMLSLPDDWDYSISGLVAICKENETAVKSTLKELQTFGYLKISKLMPDKDKHRSRIEYIYDIFEQPQEVKKQEVENLPLETQPLENPIQLSTKELNTKESNTNNIKKVSKKEKAPEKKSLSFDEIIDSYTDNEELRMELKEHLKTRKSKKATMTNRAIELSLNKLDKISNSDEEKIRIVQNAIMSGWTTFYPLKNNDYKQTNSYHGQRVTINGKEYIMKNGEYFIPKGSGIPVNPYAVDDLPF